MKNTLYGLGLSATMALSGCTEEARVYTGKINGVPAEYSVYGDLDDPSGCFLTLYFSESKKVFIRDNGCNNTADYVTTMPFEDGRKGYWRRALEQAGKTAQFDSLLCEGRKLIKPAENKVKSQLEKELDDLLQH